jgi:hypothetical protein
MADKSVVKLWPDGRAVVARELTSSEAMVTIGDEVTTLLIAEWHYLRLQCG